MRLNDVKIRHHLNCSLLKALCLAVLIFLSSYPGIAQSGRYLEAALKAESWLSTLQRIDSKGISWPDVRDSTSSTPELYSGNSGIILFYLELYHATGEGRFLRVAEKATDRLIALLPNSWDENNTGLYTGASGLVFVLHEADKMFRKKSYGMAARQVLDSLRAFVNKYGDSSSVANDIIYGYAGIGLTFLYAKKEGFMDDGLDQASKVGAILNKRMLSSSKGVARWPMLMKDTANHFFMPNFSHGTAGVAYFMARLYRETGLQMFFSDADQAARYLAGISSSQGMIRHAEPDPAAMDRYYVGWCHGPAGTARLYHELFTQTGLPYWKEQLGKAAGSVINSGIPEKPTSGYWDNVGFCCGNAGIAAFYLDMYGIYRDSIYLQFAKRVLDDLLQKSTSHGKGLQWVQAENRSRPGLLQAQTGLMQGVAGIGLSLLRADAVEKGRSNLIRLPDDPFDDVTTPSFCATFNTCIKGATSLH